MATRPDNLALSFQEVLTVVVRLRVNRQAVSDAESFRHHMREVLKTGAAEARRSGYGDQDVKDAAFATVALLDETILNSRNPLFTDWPRRTLQEELFGVHVAGETFFQNVQQIMVRNDSPEVADLLEVYYLCLLLGYRGRYSMGGRGELQAITDQIGAKIRRIRGAFSGLAHEWALPKEAARTMGSDPWVRKLKWVAIVSCAVMVLVFLVFKIMLNSGVSDLSAIAKTAQ
jgi:type VI secretion system protein ImpK